MKTFKRFTPIILVLLCMVGLLVSGYLTQKHYEILGGRSDQPSFCSFSKSFDCDAVTTSRYSELLGYPLSSFGFGIYLVLLVCSLCTLILPAKLGKVAVAWIVTFSSAAVLYDFYLLWLLSFQIKVFCILCILTYVLNLALLVFSLCGADESINVGTLPRAFTLSLRSIVNPYQFAREVEGGKEMVFLSGFCLVLVLLLTASGNEMLRFKYLGDGKINFEEVKTWYQNLPRISQELQIDQSPAHGPSAARVTIVEFSDFQCPHCQKAAQAFRPILANFHNDVRLVFKHFPLDQACNSSLQRSVHDKACLFAQAAVCARKQPGKDQFWAMHDLLFEKAASLNFSNLPDHAQELGLDRVQFLNCLSDPESRNEVLRDVELGQRLGIQGTPAIFVNDRKLPGMVSPMVLRAILRVALAE